MCRRLLALAVTLGVLFIAPSAAADPIHTLSKAQCVTAAGSKFTIPPSYIVPESDWDSLDLRMRRLQESEVRGEAENKVLRKDTGGFSWKIVTGALLLGIGLGRVVFGDK